MAAAYSATGQAWLDGPARVYDPLAGVLVGCSPVNLAGATVLDVGAGAGAGGRAARAAGAARVVGVDAAAGMLLSDPTSSSAVVVGDGLALPFAAGAFDVTMAAFVLNHLADPAAGLAEMRRVTRRGGAVLASVYADDDDHPAKAAVEAALARRGWQAAPWYGALRDGVLPLLGTVGACETVLRAAGLAPHVRRLRVPLPELDAAALVRWRLGLAQHAPFFRSLGVDGRQAVFEDAIGRLGDRPEPLVRSVLVMAAVRT